MLPKEIKDQVIFTCKALGQVVEKAKTYWEKGYSITSLVYGDYSYVVVMSKVPGWGEQTIRSGVDIPSAAISTSLSYGKSITDVINDTFEWSFVMTSIPEVASGFFEYNQSWVTSNVEDDLLTQINDKCKGDVVLTTVASKIANTYFFKRACAVTTRYKNSSITQTRRLIKDKLLIQDLERLCVGGKYIVDICQLDNGVYVVADDSTGWGKCKIIKDYYCEDLIEKIKQYWDRGYFVTTIAKCGSDWIAVLGQKKN